VLLPVVFSYAPAFEPLMVIRDLPALLEGILALALRALVLAYALAAYAVKS